MDTGHNSKDPWRARRPPIAPSLRLPPSLRGSLMKNLDWMMVAIVSASIFGHAGFVCYLRHLDWPRRPDIEDIPERILPAILWRAPEHPPTPDLVQRSDDKRGATDLQSSRLHDPPKAVGARPIATINAAERARTAAAERARISNAVSSMGVLKVIGARSAITDLVRRGGVDGDADQVFAHIADIGLASSGSRVTAPRGAITAGKALGIGELRATGPVLVYVGERRGEREAPRPGARGDEPPLGLDGTLDPSVVAAEIKKRKGAIISCYERALKLDPNLGGRIDLDFTVSAVGKVVAATVSADTMHAETVNACVVNLVRSWRFPASASGDGAVSRFSYPFVFQSAQSTRPAQPTRASGSARQ